MDRRNRDLLIGKGRGRRGDDYGTRKFLDERLVLRFWTLDTVLDGVFIVCLIVRVAQVGTFI